MRQLLPALNGERGLPWGSSEKSVTTTCLFRWNLAGWESGGMNGTRRVTPRPNMIDPIFQSDNYQLSRKLLDAAALRQEAIASNIANAETPGYHRLDLAPSFAEQLKSRIAAGEQVGSDDSLRPTLSEDTHARSVRPDGNSVEIEHELLAMNKNSVEFEYLTEVVSNNIKQLKMAITGQGS
jgi:flagellar basal-body rod protein FlgB